MRMTFPPTSVDGNEVLGRCIALAHGTLVRAALQPGVETPPAELQVNTRRGGDIQPPVQRRFLCFFLSRSVAASRGRIRQSHLEKKTAVKSAARHSVRCPSRRNNRHKGVRRKDSCVVVLYALPDAGTCLPDGRRRERRKEEEPAKLSRSLYSQSAEISWQVRTPVYRQFRSRTTSVDTRPADIPASQDDTGGGLDATPLGRTDRCIFLCLLLSPLSSLCPETQKRDGHMKE